MPIRKLAKWDGFKWCGLGFNPTPSYANLYALAVYDSALIIGGSFAALDGDTMNYVAKWIGKDYVDTCSTPVGISEIDSDTLVNFFVYPNPASNKLTVKLIGNADVKRIVLLDLLGRGL